jgi:hypothetical protein
MRIRVPFVAAVALAFAAGALWFRSTAELQAGCANNPYRSGTFRVTPNTTRALVTLPVTKRLVLSSVTSGPFASASLPWLEIYSGATLVGVVPGKCDTLGWHFETHFLGVDTQGGFNLPGGVEMSVRLVADAGPGVPVTVVGSIWDCNLDRTQTPTVLLDRDVMTTIQTSAVNQAVVIRAAISAPFEIAPDATLQPSLEIYADGNLAGVIPAQCRGRAWTFETTFPFVTGITVGPEHLIEATIRNAAPTSGPVPVSFCTMTVFSP